MSANHNFGKFQYETIIAVRKSTSILVSNTLSWRKRITGTHTCQPSGRPAKVNFTPEHDYGKTEGQ